MARNLGRTVDGRLESNETEKGAEPSKEPGLITELLAARKASSSNLTRSAAIQAERELEELRSSDKYEELVAWYFSNICSGYGYVVKTSEGLRSRRGWVSPKQLLSHLGGKNEAVYLAIKPCSPFTNWAVIDIDTDSRYHPASETGEGIELVLDAMRSIGLVTALEFQSSYSGGIHIWYPLGKPTGTWEIAVAMEEACKRNGLEIANGVLELRPNCKDFGSQYLAIRAPLTGEGNALFIPDYGFAEELLVLRNTWKAAQGKNELIWDHEKVAIKEESSSNRRGQRSRKNALKNAKERLSMGFTSRGQTQEMKLAALQVARLIESVDEENELILRTCTLIMEAPGYEAYCQHKREVGNGTYISKSEIRKALSMTPGGYHNTWKEKANVKRAEDASRRALNALAKIEKDRIIFGSMTEAFLYVGAQGGPGKSWWHKRSNSHMLEMLAHKIETRQQESDNASD